MLLHKSLGYNLLFNSKVGFSARSLRLTAVLKDFLGAVCECFCSLCFQTPTSECLNPNFHADLQRLRWCYKVTGQSWQSWTCPLQMGLLHRQLRHGLLHPKRYWNFALVLGWPRFTVKLFHRYAFLNSNSWATDLFALLDGLLLWGFCESHSI